MWKTIMAAVLIVTASCWACDKCDWWVDLSCDNFFDWYPGNACHEDLSGNWALESHYNGNYGWECWWVLRTDFVDCSSLDSACAGRYEDDVAFKRCYVDGEEPSGGWSDLCDYCEEFHSCGVATDYDSCCFLRGCGLLLEDACVRRYYGGGYLLMDTGGTIGFSYSGECPFTMWTATVFATNSEGAPCHSHGKYCDLGGTNNCEDCLVTWNWDGEEVSPGSECYEDSDCGETGACDYWCQYLFEWDNMFKPTITRRHCECSEWFEIPAQYHYGYLHRFSDACDLDDCPYCEE